MRSSPFLFYSLRSFEFARLGDHVARKGKRLSAFSHYLTEIFRVLPLEMISTKHSVWG
jgi:hypothetical protein